MAVGQTVFKGNQAVIYKADPQSQTTGLLTLTVGGASSDRSSFRIAVVSVEGSLEENFQITQDFYSNIYYTVFGEKIMQLTVRCVDFQRVCSNTRSIYSLSDFARMLREAKNNNVLPSVTITYDKFTITGYLVAIPFMIQTPTPNYSLVIMGTFK